MLEQAQLLRRRGLVIELRRGSNEDPVPSAVLPTCTVRFLVPCDLAYARCDCELGQRCAHVALAVWAFREADARGAQAATQTVVLGADRGESADPAVAAAMDALCGLVGDLLLEGAAHVAPA